MISYSVSVSQWRPLVQLVLYKNSIQEKQEPVVYKRIYTCVKGNSKM
jgi:hypothetical protein